jgi:hypothetical protein
MISFVVDYNLKSLIKILWIFSLLIFKMMWIYTFNVFVKMKLKLKWWFFSFLKSLHDFENISIYIFKIMIP